MGMPAHGQETSFNQTTPVRTVELMDVTLRDAHQSLWATRMPTGMMLPIARTMDEAGFHTIDLAGGAVFDACVMYLRENPWERIRALRSLVERTPLNFITRGQTVCRWQTMPNDVIELTLKTVVRCGIRSLKTFEPMNDIRNLVFTIRTARSLGLRVIGCVTYTLSPVHTDELFVQKARELADLGVNAVELKDPSALLTPERVRTLIPLLRGAIGSGVELHLHTHCTSALGPMCYHEALLLAMVNVFHTASAPLAHGSSLPPAEFVSDHARKLGYDVRVDNARLREIAAYFEWAATSTGRPLGRPVAYDPELYSHQVPGGMISNLVSQLKDVGMQDQLPRLLEEIVQVRAELGYPIMVSPLSQYVAVQALFNIIYGERYKVIPLEIKQYALGWYGQLAAPIDPAIADRIIGDEEPIRVPPEDLLEPMVERFRMQHGPFGSDEDLVLALFYSQQTMAEFRRSQAPVAALPAATTPLAYLLTELGQRPDIRQIRIAGNGLRLAAAT